MSHRSVWAALTIQSALVESVNSMYSFHCDLFELFSSLRFLARIPVCFTVCSDNDDGYDDGDDDSVHFLYRA